MMIRTLLAAAAATALMSGAALAQADMANQPQPADPSASQTGVPSVDSTRPTGADAGATNMPSGEVNSPANMASPSPGSAMSADSPSTGADASAVVATTTSTNGPVADTPENRAKYAPLSRAGKRTAAKGN